jgi:hypothetical protein
MRVAGLEREVRANGVAPMETMAIERPLRRRAGSWPTVVPEFLRPAFH